MKGEENNCSQDKVVNYHKIKYPAKFSGNFESLCQQHQI